MGAIAPAAAIPIAKSLAEAFGVDESPELLRIVMDGRLELSGDKALYRLAKPLELKDDSTLATVSLREPTADDFVSYSKGMKVVVKDGASEINAVMMTTRTIRAVSALGEVPGGDAVVGRFARRDLRDLEAVCDALGFFE
jgi:hypothetical protein